MVIRSWRRVLAVIIVFVVAVGFRRSTTHERCQQLLVGNSSESEGNQSAQRAAFVYVASACMAMMHEAMHAALAAPDGGPDAVFGAAMIAHHQGAIDMAQTELRYGHDQQLRRLAQEIIIMQEQEIRVMRRATSQRASSRTAHALQEP